MPFQKSERTRQYIIEKSAPLFNKKGYADTSIMDIVQETGLTKGSIYGNFKNKDDLAIEVYNYNTSLLQAGLKTAIENACSAIEKLKAMILFYRSHYKILSAKGGCPILNAAVESDDNFPLLKVKVKNSIMKWKKSIINIIEEGMKEGSIKKVDKEKYATLIIAMIEGGIMIAKINDHEAPFFNVLDNINQLINKELVR